jgi:hypothetical protein
VSGEEFFVTVGQRAAAVTVAVIDLTAVSVPARG